MGKVKCVHHVPSCPTASTDWHQKTNSRRSMSRCRTTDLCQNRTFKNVKKML